ncbi:MAG: hypothetical protein PHH54_02050 [Candidatus Nanoarchaeia archaeon]|nr:hypothetical protein [Candidatus Nanoarchaeia archaeon]MDD5740745.1 hypothetical protein [Candidatus Nanoarchaeia archaeon]
MVKKRVFLLAMTLLFAFVFASLVSATNLEIYAKTIQGSAITDLNEPAVFELTIKNLGETDNFDIYSLVGIDISPGNFTLRRDETNTIEIKAMPQEYLASTKEPINFEYKIKDSKEDIQAEKLTMNIIGLKDAFQIDAEDLNPKSENTKITLRNRLNYKFDELKISITSNFFSYEDKFPLNPMEAKQITIPVDVEKLKRSTAGSYLVNIGLEVSGVKTSTESMIKFLEQEGIETTENKEGFLIKRIEISKINVGNTLKNVEITTQKNILSYLFTTFNAVPAETKINGLTVEYTWRKELIPNDKLEVVVKTNWFYPIIIIIFAAVLFILIRRSVEVDLILRKQVSYVKTRGGEFALKVTIKAKAKTFIERINITDKLPPLVELYERYGAISPDKIDLRNKRLEWNIESLNEREERIFSYIIYSKIGVVGKFELPKARAVYEKSGRMKGAESNRSFFINQPKV